MTDTAYLAAVLSDGCWHSHTEILNRSLVERGCGLTIHSRASDLRKRGHVVETRLDRDGRGRTLSFYRLGVLGETSASPESVRDRPDGLPEASPSTPSMREVSPSSFAQVWEPSENEGVLLLFDAHDQATLHPGAYGDAA